MNAASRRAFTLIELLVVIAIIAILAAILFPVFARAREQARKSTCTSNIKQITLGMLMYTQDYDERFPAGRGDCRHGDCPSPGSGFQCWEQPDGRGIDDFNMQAMMYALKIQPYIKNKDIFVCPSSPNEGYYKDWMSGGAVPAIMNAAGFHGVDYEWKLAYSLATRCGRKLANFSVPAQQMMIIEAWGTGAPHDGIASDYTGRKNQSAVTGMNDGHVKYMRISQHRQLVCDPNRGDIDMHWAVHIDDCGWDWQPEFSLDWP